MSGIKSKRKGKSSERELCQVLSEIFGEKFIRNVTSGAYVGGKNVVRKEVLDEYRTQMVLGDIIPPESMSKMIIECKNHKDFSVSSLFFDKYAKINKWIEQYEMHDENKIIVLFAKEKRKDWAMFINASYVTDLPEDIEFMKIKKKENFYYVFPLEQIRKHKEFFNRLFSVTDKTQT